MYLKSALKLAIPFALNDRADMEEAFDLVGPDAEAARQDSIDMRELEGLAPAKFSAEQRKTARMALLWAEQYLEGWIRSLGESYPQEVALGIKQLSQIRKARLKYFGQTSGEKMLRKAVAVDITGNKRLSELFDMVECVVCSGCGARTNVYAVGDACKMCKTGVFAKAPR